MVRRLRTISICSALLLVLSQANAAEQPVRLDDFLKGLTRCERSAPFEAFWTDLSRRYSFEEGVERLKVSVKIPEEIRPAVGRAVAVNKGEYTNISVPLVGFYKDLKVANLSISSGHSNGVFYWKIHFGSSYADVRIKIGKEVQRTNRVIDRDTKTGRFIKIKNENEHAVLTCNLST